MAGSKAGERKIMGVVVKRQPALGGDTGATVVVRLNKLGRLLRRAENSKRGRATAANGSIEVVLDAPHPMAGEGPISGLGYEYPE